VARWRYELAVVPPTERSSGRLAVRTFGEGGLFLPMAFVIHLATTTVSESAGWLGGRGLRHWYRGASRPEAPVYTDGGHWSCGGAGWRGAGTESWPAGLLESVDRREQHDGMWRVFMSVDLDDVGAGTAVDLPGTARPGLDARGGAEAAVAALYEANAMSLIRLAYVMLDPGGRAAAASSA
jgi:hypothetical protein